MMLDARLTAQRQKLIRKRETMLAEAAALTTQRDNKDDPVESRIKASKDASNLRDRAKEIQNEIEQINIADALLGRIVSTLNLRKDIALYHYINWCENEECGLYAAQLSLKLGGDGYVNTPKYNAEVLGFLQNVHAICDSFPYLLNLYFRAFDFKSKNIGWNDKTMSAFREMTTISGETDLLKELEKFNKNKIFQNIQNIVNTAKHKHIIPIFFDGTKTVFGDLNGSPGHSDLSVKEFMIQVHNSLIPEILNMLKLAATVD